MITFENIYKKYEGKENFAVEDLNMTINEGEIFGFLGPNGAGKSTTISMLIGLNKMTKGKISIGNYDVLENAIDCKRMIGFVPDEPLFYENMTGRKHLNFICDVFDVSTEIRNEKIEKLSKLFSLNIDDQIRNYSHGMKQKLGIIASLVHSPKILILDEPIVGLDPKSSFILKDLLKHFCQKGGTVFFSTHVMEIAENLCDRVGIIDKGKLLFCGTFSELQDGSNDSLEKIFLNLTNADIQDESIDEVL